MFGFSDKKENKMVAVVEKEVVKFDVVCDTEPYTLKRIVDLDSFDGDRISYFEFLFVDEYSTLRVANTNNSYYDVKMDLADGEKPYVTGGHSFYDLHVSKNIKIVTEDICHLREKKEKKETENKSNSALPLVAGLAGLAVGAAISD